MPKNIMEQDFVNDTNSNSCNNRRKRVNRLKTLIVIVVIILLILPTICCIFLGLQVYRLQLQVDDILSLHSRYEVTDQRPKGEAHAYAAELNNNIILDETGHSILVEDVAGIIVPGTDSEQFHNNKETDYELEDADVSSETETESASDEIPTEQSDQKRGKYADKKVYLTFDDGPSIYTDDILDILKQYNVKATFFVVGKEDSESKKLYQRIVSEGHTLGMHSYSHQYSKIYNSIEDFDKDFTKLWKLLYDTTGYKPSIFRFPGGSDNMVNKNGMEDFIHYLNEADIVYFDWNVLNGDATGTVYTKKQLIKNVINGVATKDNSIVLLHDSQTKQTTIDSLPGLLDKLISEDAQILPLDNKVPPIQMIKADTIKQ